MSGKMLVLRHTLALWRAAGRRVLLFSQGTRMLDVLESFVRDELGYARSHTSQCFQRSQRSPAFPTFADRIPGTGL